MLEFKHDEIFLSPTKHDNSTVILVLHARIVRLAYPINVDMP